jgi:hypothetical protein
LRNLKCDSARVYQRLISVKLNIHFTKPLGLEQDFEGPVNRTVKK